MARRIDELAEQLIAVSHDIHAHPELCFEEHHATACSPMPSSSTGSTSPGRHGPEIARRPCRPGGARDRRVPGVRRPAHHRPRLRAQRHRRRGWVPDWPPPRSPTRREDALRLLGTPAEEGGNGKQHLVDDGAFDGLDAAMMVHPADADLLWMDTIAAVTVDVEWHGRPAHAAAFPWKGVNALDAAVLSYLNVAAPASISRPTERIHGIFRDGGHAPNVVPEHVDAVDGALRLDRLAGPVARARVVACWEAGARRPAADVSTGKTQAITPTWSTTPCSVASMPPTWLRFGDWSQFPGRARPALGSATGTWVTSYLPPAIHPMIQVRPVGPRSTRGVRGPRLPAGDEAVVIGAKALAATIADLWAERELIDEARSAHDEELERSEGLMYDGMLAETINIQGHGGDIIPRLPRPALLDVGRRAGVGDRPPHARMGRVDEGGRPPSRPQRLPVHLPRPLPSRGTDGSPTEQSAAVRLPVVPDDRVMGDLAAAAGVLRPAPTATGRWPCSATARVVAMPGWPPVASRSTPSTATGRGGGRCDKLTPAQPVVSIDLPRRCTPRCWACSATRTRRRRPGAGRPRTDHGRPGRPTSSIFATTVPATPSSAPSASTTGWRPRRRLPAHLRLPGPPPGRLTRPRHRRPRPGGRCTLARRPWRRAARGQCGTELAPAADRHVWFSAFSAESHDFLHLLRAVPGACPVHGRRHRARLVRDQLICGDARHMDALPDRCVALVVTSPPYFAARSTRR